MKPWPEEVQWCANNWKGKNPVAIVRKLAFNAYVYCIREERNRRLYKGETKFHNEVLQRISTLVRKKASCMKVKTEDTIAARSFLHKWCNDVEYYHKQPIMCSWLRPTHGKFMINTDGSLSEGSGSFGAIIRDSQGDVISAAAGSAPNSSITVLELRGVELGTQLASNQNWQHVIVASDSMAAVQILKKQVEPPWQAITTIRRIRQLRCLCILFYFSCI